MLKDLENTLKSHQDQIDHLAKVVAKIEASSKGTQKLTYTVKEAAEALGVKQTTIRAWISEGKLKATLTGKNFLIPTNNLLQLINE